MIPFVRKLRKVTRCSRKMLQDLCMASAQSMIAQAFVQGHTVANTINRRNQAGAHRGFWFAWRQRGAAGMDLKA
jgi:hypothetical protein